MPFLYHESEERILATNLAAARASFAEMVPSPFAPMRRTSFSCAGVRVEIRVEIESVEGSGGRSSSTERWQSCFAALMIPEKRVVQEMSVQCACYARLRVARAVEGSQHAEAPC